MLTCRAHSEANLIKVQPLEWTIGRNLAQMGGSQTILTELGFEWFSCVCVRAIWHQWGHAWWAALTSATGCICICLITQINSLEWMHHGMPKTSSGRTPQIMPPPANGVVIFLHWSNMELARLVGQLRFPTANMFYEDCWQQVGSYPSKKKYSSECWLAERIPRQT